ncbi:hypothetical protein BDW22DRAFT_1433176 [Trametopsis cervina]|nr:hypothetical protein BDW22DRAFT_1433176 [Trametopsis cervina]
MPPPGLWTRAPTRDALHIVKTVLARHTNPIRIQDLYKQALKEPCTPPGGSVAIETASGVIHPPQDHAVRSMRYLKQVLLPVLASQNHVVQVRVKPTVNAQDRAQMLAKMNKTQRRSAAVKAATLGYFGWKVKEPSTPPPPRAPRAVFGEIVGVGEDWSHLNKRRQRARTEKVSRDVEWLREVETARSQASRNAS